MCKIPLKLVTLFADMEENYCNIHREIVQLFAICYCLTNFMPHNNDCDTRILSDTRHVCGEGGYQYLYVVPHGVVKQPRGQRVYQVCVGDGDHYVGARCAQQ